MGQSINSVYTQHSLMLTVIVAPLLKIKIFLHLPLINTHCSFFSATLNKGF